MQRLMVTGTDDRFFRYAQLAVASFRRHNPSWPIQILDVGMTAEQRQHFAREGVSVERCLRNAPTGPGLYVPSALARCRSLAELPDNGTLMLYLDADTLTLGNVDSLVGLFLASGRPLGLTPEIDRRFHTFTAAGGWIDERIPREFPGAARWATKPNLNTGVVLARGAAAAEIGRAAVGLYDSLASRSRFAEQSLIAGLIYEREIPIFPIPSIYNCMAFERHLRHEHAPYKGPLWLGEERLVVRHFANGNKPALDAALPALLESHSKKVPRDGPFEVSVVIPSVARSTLTRSLKSIFDQTAIGNVQVLIGIDGSATEPHLLESAMADAPAHVRVEVVDLGYSTGHRKGGNWAAADGGSLRTALSYLARARYVAYLDDDNWWSPDHLQSLLDAVAGRDWAYSLRWFVDDEGKLPPCVDRWESVGPDAGAFRERFGGFVDPSCLLLDAVACEPALRLWCQPLPPDRTRRSADRTVFDWLRRNRTGAGTGRATSYYSLGTADGNHAVRQKWMETAAATAFSLDPIS